MRLLKKKVICAFMILLVGAMSFAYYLYTVNKDNLNQQVYEGEVISSIIDNKGTLSKLVYEAESLGISVTTLNF